jgi:hypothetical protein
MAISSVLPSEATDSEWAVNFVDYYTAAGNNIMHLRDVAKGAHLWSIQRQARIALVRV